MAFGEQMGVRYKLCETISISLKKIIIKVDTGGENSVFL